MPLDISDPRIIRFLIESYETEGLLRVRWFYANKARLDKAAGIGRQLKGITKEDVLSLNIKSGVDALAVAHQESQENRIRVHTDEAKEIKKKKDPTLKDLGLASESDSPDTVLTLDRIMRPVDPETKQIIYLPKPEYGRLEYLSKRNKLNPEDKYYFAETTSWDYGWRTKDSAMMKLQNKARHYGRHWVLSHELQVRSGPQPDPHHYTQPAPPPEFCATIS